MKYISLALSVISILILSCAPAKKEYLVLNTSSQKIINLKQTAKELAEYDIIVFGEIRGHNVVHELQEELVRLLSIESPDIVLSLQVFERDIQRVLDEYLLDRITEEEFLDNSRVWYGYTTDYRSLIEYAKIESIPIVASGAPSNYISEVKKSGLEWLDSVPPENRIFVAYDVVMTDDAYRDMFMRDAINKPQIIDHSLEVVEYQLHNLYAAQSLQDDTMAESIVNYYSRLDESMIFHINEEFHSRNRLGVVTKIKNRNPNLKIAVINCDYMPENQRIELTPNLRYQADYILFVNE